jgi:hypothetical protein
MGQPNEDRRPLLLFYLLRDCSVVAVRGSSRLGAIADGGLRQRTGRPYNLVK